MSAIADRMLPPKSALLRCETCRSVMKPRLIWRTRSGCIGLFLKRAEVDFVSGRISGHCPFCNQHHTWSAAQ